MPKQITEIESMRLYISGVMERADHHANGVSDVILTLAGALIWKKDTDPISVFEINGQLKNVLWISINGKKYAFSYNHDVGSIEMRENTTQGQVLRSFMNDDTPHTIREYFNSL